MLIPARKVRAAHIAVVVLTVFIGMLMSLPVYGQFVNKQYHYNIGVLSAVAYHGDQPFWSQTNRYGIIDPNSSNILTDIGIETVDSTSSKFDYGYGTEWVGRVSSHSDIYPVQLYGKIRYGSFQMEAGRFKEHLAIDDPDLSSGSVLWSENATPMPKIAIFNPHYVPIPFMQGFGEFKGYFSNGWLGPNRYASGAYLHQASLFLRGERYWPVHPYGGITHVAIWGGSNSKFGQLPQSLSDFIRVVLGQRAVKGEPGIEKANVLGDHIGSWFLGFEWDRGDFTARIYRQSIFEDKSGLRLGQGSIKDGIVGVELNTKKKNSIVSDFLWEFLYSKNQSGPALPDPPPGDHSPTDSAGYPWGGQDDYFNNLLYRSGYTYYGRIIGTPLFDVYPGPGFLDKQKIVNNRVVAQHFGVEGTLWKQIHYRTFVTYSRNYGTYRALDDAIKQNLSYHYLPRVDRYECMMEVSTPLGIEGLMLTTTATADFRTREPNRYGFLIGINYQGLFSFRGE